MDNAGPLGRVKALEGALGLRKRTQGAEAVSTKWTNTFRGFFVSKELFGHKCCRCKCTGHVIERVPRHCQRWPCGQLGLCLHRCDALGRVARLYPPLFLGGAPAHPWACLCCSCNFLLRPNLGRIAGVRRQHYAARQ